MTRRRTVLLIILVIAVFWFFFAGRLLVRTDAIRPADAVIVLSGDGAGERLQRGTAIFNAASASRLVVFLSRGEAYDPREDIRDYLSAQKIPDKALRFGKAQPSTGDEAGAVAELVDECGWDSLVVVTSPYHTRRARRLVQKAVGSDASIMMTASEESFNANRWWASERDAELVAIEWIKTMNSFRYTFKRPPQRDPGTGC